MSDDIFPFENYKTETAVKFVKFIQALDDDAYIAVQRYVTDGLDLIELDGDLESAKDECEMISTAIEDEMPFETPDEYLEALLETIYADLGEHDFEIPDVA